MRNQILTKHEISCVYSCQISSTRILGGKNIKSTEQQRNQKLDLKNLVLTDSIEEVHGTDASRNNGILQPLQYLFTVYLDSQDI